MPNNQQPNPDRERRQAKPGRPDERGPDDMDRPDHDQERTKKNRRRNQERPQ